MKNNQIEKILEFQLDREPLNFREVAKSCPFSYPAVIITTPYTRSNGVFPTTYWLSCPYLVEEVGKLEDRGLIREFTNRLEKDQNFRRAMKSAHRRYARQRLQYLEDGTRAELEDLSPDILKVIAESGVGGIRDKGGIKCLHTHLADYLVNKSNPVGKLVWGQLVWPDECNKCKLDNQGSDGD